MTVRLSSALLTLVAASSFLATIAVASPFAYIPNKQSGTVSVIDTATDTIVATIAVGDGPEGVAVNTAGTRVYVTRPYGGGTFAVIDAATNTVVANGNFSFAYGAALNPAGTRIYTADSGGNSVQVINTVTNTLVTTITGVGFVPVGVAATATRVYVSTGGHIFTNGITVIDSATNMPIATIPVGGGGEANPAGGAWGLALNGAATRLYAAGNHLSVIDTSNNQILGSTQLYPAYPGCTPGVDCLNQRPAVAVNAAGTRGYVTDYTHGALFVVDLTSSSVVTTIAVGNGPSGVAVHPFSPKVYVVNSLGNSVSVIDTNTNSVIATIPVGTEPIGFGQFIATAPPSCFNGPDADGDLFSDACDDCPAEFNPDQLNSDCPDASFFAAGLCSGSVPVTKTGCCDDGDVCDACPAEKDNTNCDSNRSGGINIGSSGGAFTTPDGCVGVSVPAGALSGDTSISVTAGGSNNPVFQLDAAQLIYTIAVRPSGQAFANAASLSFCWADRDQDGIVDRGKCQCPTAADNGFSCDANGDCTCNSCSPGSFVQENNLVLKRNGSKFSELGFGAAPFTCADHQSASSTCATASATCPGVPDVGDSTVANCCVNSPGTVGSWGFKTCRFSDLYLGTPVGDLIPGKGSPLTDCTGEWALHDALAPDAHGLPSFKQSCTDGDPACDADRVADGKCVFEVGVCLNDVDTRLALVGGVQCAPGGVSAWRVKKPRPDASDATDAANAASLRDAVSALDPGSTVGGGHDDVVTFSTPLSTLDVCSGLVPVIVALESPTEKGKTTLKVAATNSTTNHADTDTLKLTCEPSTP